MKRQSSDNNNIAWSCGPYYKQLISECTDAHHLVHVLWFGYGTPAELKAAEKRALEIGCVCLGEKSWWTPQEIGSEMYKRAYAKYNNASKLLPILQSGKEIVLDMQSNISLTGEYEYEGITFKFPYVHYEENSHQLEHSYIKDLKTGKGKKCKGKQVKINKYLYKDNRVECIDYQVLK